MNGDLIRYRGLIAVAVGAGVMIGAAGVFLYQQLFGERKRLVLQQDINNLGLSVAEIRRELNALRSQQLRKGMRGGGSAVGGGGGGGAQSVVTDAETDMFSAVGTEDIDDEFYDFSSDNETVVDEANNSSFDEIDVLLEGTSREDKTKAYGLLLELHEKNGEDDEVLWRLAKACHMMSSLYGAEGDNDKKKEFIFKGVEYGQKALEINNSSWKAHKWFAICVGGRGQLQSVKDKLRDGHMFKEHLDAAIAINSTDPTLHHLVGRFNYEVSTLTWFEKKVANSLLGGVPNCSYKDAITSLLEAERLNPTPWKENQLLLSKCYVAEQNYQQALHWLDVAKTIPANSAEDLAVNKEIDTLLKKYSMYRGLET